MFLALQSEAKKVSLFFFSIAFTFQTGSGLKTSSTPKSGPAEIPLLSIAQVTNTCLPSHSQLRYHPTNTPIPEAGTARQSLQPSHPSICRNQTARPATAPLVNPQLHKAAKQ
jgi:hypothetical protein